MEEVLTVSQFKAKCLDIFNRLATHRLDKVTVTRRGKPVAIVHAPPVDQDAVRSLHGFMKGSVDLPPDFDLTTPVFDGEIEAESGRLHG